MKITYRVFLTNLGFDIKYFGFYQYKSVNIKVESHKKMVQNMRDYSQFCFTWNELSLIIIVVCFNFAKNSLRSFITDYQNEILRLLFYFIDVANLMISDIHY